MGHLDDRLKRLEEAAKASKPYAVPIHTRILAKAVAREQARHAGEEPPEYDAEELRARYESDREVASGGGWLAELRNGQGWKSPLEQRLLDLWEEQARRRVEAAQSLPLAEVYDARECVRDELDEAFDDIFYTLFHHSYELDDDYREGSSNDD